ncbi:MAG TPA: hypothetical protein PLI45_03950 [Candidatus Woesebacteria bacterium]|nr:hypothetical protein [Candidatus Woesebacteria bacterium]
MKKGKNIANKLGFWPLLVGILAVLLFGMATVYGRQVRQGWMNSKTTVTRGNCLADECLLVENLEYPVGELSTAAKTALNEAINDEYKALAVYQKITAKLGTVRPFSIIKGAEEQHIASLTSLFSKYGLAVPQNTWTNKVTSPNTLKEACQAGVDAEVANASLYKEKLLPAVSDYEDITLVFTNLMNASKEKHLPAFEKCN